MSDRRSRQRRVVVVFGVLAGVVAILAFVAGISFELGRWLARSDTDNNLPPVEDWFR